MKTKKKQAPGKNTTITWLGHSAFLLVSPKGKSLVIDPWLKNPKAPPSALEIQNADIILITHGHGDHIGNGVGLATRTGATVISNYEVSLYFQGQGVTKVQGINKSGSVEIDGITVTMVDATHSSGIEVGEHMLAGGDPAGFIIQMENGFTVYHAGDTGVFGDMKLIAELYHPHVALLPIGGYYTMGPREAAKAAELITPKFIIGMHYGTFPILKGTPAELKKHLPKRLKNRLLVLEPGTPVIL